ncbi:MAG TPA: hypothetical protein VGM87_21345 [Roseomonas sp.]|jgi:hypothetical protein
MRRSLAGFVVLALLAGPALAQTDAPGSLPPPVQQPAAGRADEPGVGQRIGATAGRAASGVARGTRRAARATTGAARRATRWTGSRLERAGDWTRHQGQRLSR